MEGKEGWGNGRRQGDKVKGKKWKEGKKGRMEVRGHGSEGTRRVGRKVLLTFHVSRIMSHGSSTQIYVFS